MIALHTKPRLQTRHQSVNSLLDSYLQQNLSDSRLQGFTPAVDLWETQSGYTLEIALPGLKKEDVGIEFQEGVLTVSGTRAFQNGEQERKYHRVENLYGAFKRSFRLPEHIDATAIDASLQDGVLLITVPKLEEKVTKRQIAVK